MRLRAGTILTILGLGLAACGGHETRQANEPPAGPAKDVRTVEIVRGGGVGEVAVPAPVQSRKRAALSARMPASVTELPYQEGQWVEAGAVVVRLDDAALRAAVTAAEASLAAVESDLARTKALLEKGAATPRELEQITAAASGARAQLTGAKDNLSYAALRAPFAGRVASRRVNLGDVVNPGMPLIEIEGEGGLELRATVESELAATLRPGSKLRAMVDGQPSPLTATVTAVAPSGRPDHAPLRAEGRPARGRRSARRAVRAPADSGHRRGSPPDGSRRRALRARRPHRALRGERRQGAPALGGRRGARRRRGSRSAPGVEAGERVVLEPAGLVDGAPVSELQQPRLASELGPFRRSGDSPCASDSPAGSPTPSSTASSRRSSSRPRWGSGRSRSSPRRARRSRRSACRWWT